MIPRKNHNRVAAFVSALAFALTGCGRDGASGASVAASATSAPPDSRSTEHAMRTALVSERFVVEEPSRAASETARAAGDEDAVRHVYSHVSVVVEHGVARTTVTDVFVNDTASPERLVYRFPLPGDAAIVEVAEIAHGERRVATIAGRDEAREQFERAAADGEQAALGERETGGFRFVFSPIEPHDSRRVELTYVETLVPFGGERTYAFPHAHVDDAGPRLFEFEAMVLAAGEVTEIASPNHPDARVAKPVSTGGVVRLSRLGEPLGSDVVVRWRERSEPISLAGRAASAEGDGYFEAAFSFASEPFADVGRPPVDVVLIVDTSLSMAGEPLAAAKEAASRALDLVREGDRVAVVTFADAVHSSASLLPCSPEVVASMKADLEALAPRGGSNVDAAVDRAAELIRGSTRAAVLVLTDGQSTVGADLETLTPASTPADFANVRTLVGLFNYPSRERAMAPLFKDTDVRFVPNGPEGLVLAKSLAQALLAPAIEGLVVRVQGAVGGSVVMPETTRVVLGDSLRIVGRAEGAVSVTVSGTLFGRTIHEEWASQPAHDARLRDAIGLEWARVRIRTLEDAYRASPTDELRAQIRELGVRHSLATMFTSFVATDTLGPDRVMPGDPEIRVRAPRSAESVYGVLPWGEVVSCAFDANEEVWAGRFLVPRSVTDGLYRVRVFVVSQGVTTLRSTLQFRVDDKPPVFDVRAELRGEELWLVGRAVAAVYESYGDRLVELPEESNEADVRRLSVRIGRRIFELVRDGAVWTARLDGLSPGAHAATVSAIDYASNVSQVDVTLEVP